jgi:hypothetical protein
MSMSAGDAYARCYKSGEDEDACNKKYWYIDVTIHASIAQWVEWSINGTRWDWFVRKPGTYIADCIEAKVASNGDVIVQYRGFDFLRNGEDDGIHKDSIDIWYAFEGAGVGAGDLLNPANAHLWIPAPALNMDDDTLFENNLEFYNLHYDGAVFKLWNKIFVDRCNSACEYEDEARIILVLDEQKDWIDPETGYYRSPFFP